MSSSFLAGIAACFAAVAVSVWAVFLRPVPIETFSAVIVSKRLKPAGTYWQSPPGTQRGFRSATPIPIAEAVVFELKTPDFPAPVYVSLNTQAAQAFDVGQTVRFTAQRRVIPFVSERVYVLEMTK